MKSNFYKAGLILLFLFVIQNCSELSFRSDQMSMTMTKYENRSSNKYIFLAHEGDDCHLLRHKRIHNFFFLFPLNSFSKEEIQEISQQKMIRYKNIMRLGDFAWTFFLLPITMLTYSIEVETCNTGMVAVTRRDPLYLETLKNNKGETPKEETVAQLDLDPDSKGKGKKTNSEISRKSINPKPAKEIEPENESAEEPTEIETPPKQKKQKRKLRFKEKPNSDLNGQGEEINNSDNEPDSKIQELDTSLPPEEVWNSANVANESTIAEKVEPFNPEVYKMDGTFPIIWNYKNSITNRINENVKPFSILFPKNGVELSDWEEKKLDAFAQEYLESYATSKILLIGHSEWANGKGVTVTLSQHRAEAVREYLIAKNISSEKILLSFSGGLWGEANEAKFGKPFSRRVDIVFLY